MSFVASNVLEKLLALDFSKIPYLQITLLKREICQNWVKVSSRNLRTEFSLIQYIFISVVPKFGDPLLHSLCLNLFQKNFLLFWLVYGIWSETKQISLVTGIYLTLVILSSLVFTITLMKSVTRGYYKN